MESKGPRCCFFWWLSSSETNECVAFGVMTWGEEGNNLTDKILCMQQLPIHLFIYIFVYLHQNHSFIFWMMIVRSL